jgi:hypothetical protein
MLPTPGECTRTRASWRVKAVAKTWLARFGYTPFDFESFVGRLRRRPVSVVRTLLRQGRTWLLGRDETVVLRRENSAASVSASEASHASVHRDAIDDLLLYRENGTGETRRAFLSDALSRIEAGQHVYTLVEDGRLRGCAWVCEVAAAESLTEELPGFTVPSDGAVILNVRDCSTDGRASDTLHSVILGELGKVGSIRQVFLAAAIGSSALRRAERAEFARWGSVTRTTRFGVKHVGSTFPAAPAGAAAAAQEAIEAVVARDSNTKQPNQKQTNQKQPNPKQPRKRASVEVGQSEPLEAPSAA